jgi:hypothetical protein
MQKLKQLYRANYAGENIVTHLTLENNEWTTATEFVPNQVTNTHTTTQAVAIGNGESRLEFDLTHLTNHKGGLFGVDKLQSYGCNALYRDFTPDFLVATGDAITKEIADSGYTASNIVYANAATLLAYPGKFYLIPQNAHFDAGALAVYLACFDGHTTIYMLGYDNYDDEVGPINNVYKDTAGYPASTDEDNGEFFALSLTDVMKTYNDVDFVRVMPAKDSWMPDRFRPLPNLRQINYRDFVLEADVG